MPMFKNIEGLQDYNIVMPETRPPGLSAMIRVKDEAEYLERSVESIINWMDEVVICLQGEQSDRSSIIAETLANKYPDKIMVYCYPFNSFPNGPGHDKQKLNSAYERAYFYNWCLSKTTRQYVCKWDGDMIALDGAGVQIREQLGTVGFMCLTGSEMVSETHQSIKPFTACEPRIFKVTDETYYITGSHCEILNPKCLSRKHKIFPGHQFKHFKWAKSQASISKAWPENWEEIHHFQGLMKRKQQGQEYAGPK